MKKLIALLMVCGFALTFVACGGGAKKTDEPAAPAPDTTQAPTQDTLKNDSL